MWHMYLYKHVNIMQRRIERVETTLASSFGFAATAETLTIHIIMYIHTYTVD